jgi:hypothetical protein
MVLLSNAHSVHSHDSVNDLNDLPREHQASILTARRILEESQ